MAKVNLAVDQDVYDLLDTEFVEENLSGADAYITFSCVKSENWQDDNWIGEDGKPSYVIKLPYAKVKRMKKENVRKLMLAKALERLQQVA